MKLSAPISIFNRVSFVDKMLFTKHLSIMLKSGIPITEAIQIIEDQNSNPTFKKILHKVNQDISNGQKLHVALAKYPKVFNMLFVNLIKVGEESGNLEVNLEYLSGQLEKEYIFNRTVKGALLYPEIVLVTAFVIGTGVSFFVLPQLVDLFGSLDVDLPLATRVLLGFSNIMKDFGVFIFIGLIALFILFRFLITLSKIKPIWHRFLLNMPVIGKFLQNVELSSFCRNLGIMLKSGLPITVSLEAEAEATGNLVYKKIFSQLQRGVEKGQSIEEVLSHHRSKYVPQIASKMIGIGERTGKLEDSLVYLGDYFESEVDNSSKNFSNVLEPIMLLVIGVIVAFVALAIISPIYQITGSVQR